MIGGSYQRHPYLPLVFTIFRANDAKDWFTGTRLSSTNVGPSYQLEFHHVFPRSVLRGASIDYTREEIDDLGNMAFLSQKANRAILDSKPKDYLGTIEEERLRAQFVPTNQALWEVSEFRRFLGERRQLVAAAVNSYLQDLGKEYF